MTRQEQIKEIIKLRHIHFSPSEKYLLEYAMMTDEEVTKLLKELKRIAFLIQ